MTGKSLFLIIWPLLLLAGVILHKYLVPHLNKTIKRILNVVSIILMIAFALLTVYTLYAPGDSSALSAWNAEHMDYSRLHKYSTGSSQTIVLIDSGISYSQHEQVKESFNLTDGSEYDINGHGTMMLSILKGVAGQIEGIAPDVNVISMKVVDDTGKTEKETMLKALEKVLTLEDVDIVNLSIATYIEDENIAAVINQIIDAGIIVVASSGDYETDSMLFPASMKRVISVGALSANGRPWNFTNAPDSCDILAPGDEIPSLSINGNVESHSGTSQATILISGYIALLKDHAEQNQQKMGLEEILAVLHEIQTQKVSYSYAFKK